MAEIQDPRTGIWYDFDLGYTTWKTKMDANLKLLGLMQQFAVIDRDLTAPPGGESDGDSYIVGPSATGLWAGQEDDIAIWIDADSAWTFLTPKEGWICFIEDEAVLSEYTGTLWTVGITLDGQLSIIDRDLTAPPGSESNGDAYIPASGSTGDWAGHDDEIAIYDLPNTTYWFITPKVGRNMFVVDEAIMIVWSGSAWAAV